MTDASIVLAFQRATASPAARAVVGFCARWLIYLYVPFAVSAFRLRAYRVVVIEAAWTALLAFATSSLISVIVGRARPYLSVPGVMAIVPPNIQAGSFPSSHTAIAVGVAFALASGHPELGAAVAIIACLVGLARIAAGMHFPTDILGGIAVGIIAYVAVRAIRQGMGYTA